MMVAEFVTRQYSGSPINGETPNQNHTNSSMPINVHGQNMLGNGNTASNVINIGTNNGLNSNNGARNGHHRSSSHQNHHNFNNVSTSSSPTGFLHDSHSNSSLIHNSGAMSPNSQDGFPPGYDIAAHLKRKELFTQRKQREFIPDNKKDDSYWDRRRRNNEAAKRSREKRRYNDMVLEQRVVELTKENHVLKAQLDAIKDKYNICGENLVSVEQIMATLPTVEQVLSITKRAKFNNNGSPPSGLYPQSPSPPAQISVIQQPVSIDSPPPPPPPPSSTSVASAICSIGNPLVTQPPQIQSHSSSSTTTTSFTKHLNNPSVSSIHHIRIHQPIINQSNFHLSDAVNTAFRPSSPMRSTAIEGRHDVFGGRSNFHNSDNPNSSHTTGNSININSNYNVACNGNGVNSGPRYIQNLSSSARLSGAQNDHHHLLQHHPHHHQHHQELHFGANDGPSVNKISQSNVSNGVGSENDLNTLDETVETNVLNLSRRRNSDTTNCNNNNNNNKTHLSELQHMSGHMSSYEVFSVAGSGNSGSATSGSSTTSGDDEQCCNDNQPLSDVNNSLPLKLRHKSHLGDKDAATALLALQHIKQEPNLRLSPTWDGEGSSDERDSGISIGAAEWGIQRKIIIPTSVSIGTIGGIGAAIGNLAANLSSVGVVGGLTMGMGSVLGVGVNGSGADVSGNIKEENVHLKSQIARLESEVATIKNMMILNTTTGSATAVQ